MKIKVIKAFHDINDLSVLYGAGAVVDLSVERAERVIALGWAEALEPRPATPKEVSGIVPATETVDETSAEEAVNNEPEVAAEPSEVVAKPKIRAKRK